MPVQLIYIHGWAFDTSIWFGIRGDQICVDLGFFDNHSKSIAEIFNAMKSMPKLREKRVLVGHSLGFIIGMNSGIDWDGWIAINSFPRFVKSGGKTGCVAPSVLRDMRMRLDKDAQKTVKDFHNLIGAHVAYRSLNSERLREGLDLLRNSEIDLAAARKIPGLVLSGAKDPLVPMEASAPLAAVAAESELYEDSGHVIPQGEAARCSKDIAGFIKRHFGNTDVCLTHSA